MKVVTAKTMTELEAMAYRNGASETDFMEEAGSGIALVVHDYAEDYGIDPHVILLCGKGNNGGDAYVAGIHLLHLDYRVEAYQMAAFEDCSPLCRQNASRFAQDGGTIIDFPNVEEIRLPSTGMIIDGLFGTGFHGSTHEPFSILIRKANDSGLPIFAIDIPSGLNGETGEVQGEVIIATKTIFLGLPKTGFFLGEGWDHIGKLHYVDFGLALQYIEEIQADFTMLSQGMMRPLIPTIRPSRHKYEAGSVIGLAGSKPMPGAALLASLAALRGGAGIVHLYHPQNMDVELVASAYELIKVPFDPSQPKKIIEAMNNASANFIGPGLGQSEETKTLIKNLLPELTRPLVIDADALNIIASEKLPIPKNAVLTPHLGEFGRLCGKKFSKNYDRTFLDECQEYAEKHSITLVLKGGPTFIFHPNETVLVNPTGDPGMATAGSGDVLTGLIASLLAQGLTPHAAAALGVYVHGVAGEHSAEEMTSPCMIASDLIDSFPDAFDSLL